MSTTFITNPYLKLVENTIPQSIFSDRCSIEYAIYESHTFSKEFTRISTGIVRTLISLWTERDRFEKIIFNLTINEKKLLYC